MTTQTFFGQTKRWHTLACWNMFQHVPTRFATVWSLWHDVLWWRCQRPRSVSNKHQRPTKLKNSPSVHLDPTNPVLAKILGNSSKAVCGKKPSPNLRKRSPERMCVCGNGISGNLPDYTTRSSLPWLTPCDKEAIWLQALIGLPAESDIFV